MTAEFKSVKELEKEIVRINSTIAKAKLQQTQEIIKLIEDLKLRIKGIKSLQTTPINEIIALGWVSIQLEELIKTLKEIEK